MIITHVTFVTVEEIMKKNAGAATAGGTISVDDGKSSYSNDSSSSSSSTSPSSSYSSSGSRANYDSAVAAYNMGVQLNGEGDYDGAIEAFNTSIRLDGGRTADYSNHGLAYSYKGDYDNAFKDFKSALMAYGDNTATLVYRGNLYFLLKQYDKALFDYYSAFRSYTSSYTSGQKGVDAYTEESPGFVANAYEKRGLIYHYFKVYELAIDDYKKALEIMPGKNLCIENIAIAEQGLHISQPGDDIVNQAIAAYGKKDFKKAFKLTEKAANMGNTKAIYNLWVFCYEDVAGKGEYGEKVDLLAKLAERAKILDNEPQHSRCCVRFNSTQQVPPQKTASPVTSLKAAAKVSPEEEYCNQALEAENAKDYKKAFELYKKAADNGYLEAQNNIAVYYDNGYGVKQDSVKAMELLTTVAEQGYTLAQRNLGKMYRYGRGCKQDLAKAEEYFNKAIAAGFESAKAELAKLQEMKAAKPAAQLSTDDLVVQGWEAYEKEDYAKAVELFRKAADSGNAEGQCGLGDCYYHGDGVKQDYKKAAELYRKATEQGLASAMVNYGSCYTEGEGVKQDLVKAAEWFRTAAELGDTDGQFNFGSACVTGEGVQKDKEKGFEWIRNAAAQEHEEAIELLDKINKAGLV